MLLTAGLDDALGVEERPNMPGTTDEWPNWCIALPLALEEIQADRRPRAVAGALDRTRQDTTGA
jgi:4-alpha-glucanotransferase